MLESVVKFLPILFSETLSSMHGLCWAKQFSLLQQFCELEGGEFPSATCLKVELTGSATCERGTS